MGTAMKRRLGAVGCALLLLLCLPLVKPWLDMGTMDDVSYTRSAQMLAQTGHIVYNGWATAMLGWQLYWGALFIKLFGFSFNVVRLSMLPVAMATAFISQRSMVRAGLTERNSTLATLTLVLSPMFLPLTFSFMSDVPGMLVIVLCFYGCLRALQASSDRNACLWLAFTAITNGVGGSVRQIAWLGLLVMIPCALWMLRKRRAVLVWGSVSVVCGLGIMFATMLWFRHQPMSVREPLWLGAVSRRRALITIDQMAKLLFDAPVFLLPLLFAYVPRVPWKDRKARAAFVGTISLVILALLVIQPQPSVWLEPSMRDYVTEHGVVDGSYINGLRPVILTPSIRVVLTGMVLAGIGSVAALLRVDRPLGRSSEEASSGAFTWPTLFALIIPFSAVYLGLMLSRAGIYMLVDRYVLVLLFFLLLLLTLYYQQRISPQLPRYCFVLLAIVAAYGVAATHDAFAMLRARLQAIREVQSRGVPDIHIDGGFEFNMSSDLSAGGVLIPFEGIGGPPIPVENDPDLVCEPELGPNMPLVHPRYALSFDPNACGGPVGIPPVPYREWLGPREANIYVVSSRKQPPGPARGQN